jgi:hypothetical protein
MRLIMHVKPFTRQRYFLNDAVKIISIHRLKAEADIVTTAMDKICSWE